MSLWHFSNEKHRVSPQMRKIEKAILAKAVEKFGETNQAELRWGSEQSKIVIDFISGLVSRARGIDAEAKQLMALRIQNEYWFCGPIYPLLIAVNVRNFYLEGSRTAFVETVSRTGRIKLEKGSLGFDDDEHMVKMINQFLRLFNTGKQLQQLSEETPVILLETQWKHKVLTTIAPFSPHGPTFSLVPPKPTYDEAAVPGWSDSKFGNCEDSEIILDCSQDRSYAFSKRGMDMSCTVTGNDWIQGKPAEI